MTDGQAFLENIKTGVRRIVINTCYGGFGLSNLAEKRYKELAGITAADWSYYQIERDDPYLVKIVRELGMSANGDHANLKIVEVPADVDWHVTEYDGNEWVAEKHRTWS
jgi:hypothetical protein